jgi:Kdo2-lipid IVA lauroyltransferase/acyltransferase
MKIKTRRYYIYYFVKILFFFINLIPLKVSMIIAEMLGKIGFNVLEDYRKLAEKNLIEVLCKDTEEAHKIAEKVFVNLCKNGAEWVKILSEGTKCAERVVSETIGLENIDKAIARGNGVIILAHHFGNWELLLAYLRHSGYNGTIIGKKIYFHKYDKFITRMRKKTGVELIYRDESPKKIVKVLRAGGMIGILADQDVDSVEGVFVKYFGKDAYTPVAPVKLASLTGASIVPCFTVRNDDDTHKVIIKEPINIEKSDRSETVLVKYTQQWTKILEDMVREYPDQWVWIHDRWKTKKS